jgi:two-component system, LytTR family, sensor kinase
MSMKQEEGQLATAAPASPDREYQRARERAKAIQGLYTHLVVYAVVNSGLFLINWLTRGEDGNWWFFWPLVGWGLAVAIHVVATFVPVFSPEWAERRAERMLRRREHHG